MKTYNLKESLIQMDKDTDFKYTLTDLYEACQLDEAKKKALVQYIEARDPVGMNAMLCNEAGVMAENFADDDLLEATIPSDWISYNGGWIYPTWDGEWEGNLDGLHYAGVTKEEVMSKIDNAVNGGYTADKKLKPMINAKGLFEASDNTPSKEAIIDWLSEHEQAYEDAQSFFEDLPLEAVAKEDLISWIEDHKTLNDDFVNFFNNVDEAWSPNLTDCPECGDTSFDSKKGRCTKCFYRESLKEAFEEGDMVYVKPSNKCGRVVRVKGDTVEVEIMGGKDPDRRDTFYASDLELEDSLNDSEELDFSIYNLTDDQIEKVKYIRQNLDTVEGYKAYYELEKEITDEGGCMDIFYDLSADFAWDNRFSVAITKLALADGRPDLADPEYLPGGAYAEYMNDPKYADVLLEGVKDTVIDTAGLKTNIMNAIHKYLDDIEDPYAKDYIFVDITEDDERVKVQVRTELDYEQCMTLCDLLNPIVAAADPESYFEPYDSHTIDAYIRKDQSEDIPDEAMVAEWSEKFNGCKTWDELKNVYGEFYHIRDDLNNGTHRALYNIIDKKIDELKPVQESLTENTQIGKRVKQKYANPYNVGEIIDSKHDDKEGHMVQVKWDYSDGPDVEWVNIQDVSDYSEEDEKAGLYEGIEKSLTEALDSDIPSPYNKYYEIGINREDIPEEDIPDAFDNYTGMNLLAIVYAKEQYEDALGNNCLDYCYLVEDDQGKMIVTTAGPRVYAVELDEIERCIGDNIEEALTEDAEETPAAIYSMLDAADHYVDNDEYPENASEAEIIEIAKNNPDCMKVTKWVDGMTGPDEVVWERPVSTWFICQYEGGREYEHAEGGYYYETLTYTDKETFKSKEDARKRLAELIEEAKSEGQDVVAATDDFFRIKTGRYIGDCEEYHIEAKEGAHASSRKIYEGLNEAILREMDSPKDKPYSAEEIKKEIKSLTQNFTRKKDNLKCGFKEENDAAVKELKKHYAKVTSEKRGQWFEITFSEPKKALKEASAVATRPSIATVLSKNMDKFSSYTSPGELKFAMLDTVKNSDVDPKEIKKFEIALNSKKSVSALLSTLAAYATGIRVSNKDTWKDVKSEALTEGVNESVTLASDYFYDNLKNLEDAGWNDVVDFVNASGWVKDDKVIIPAGTILTFNDTNRYFDYYYVMTNAGPFVIPFNKDFTAESPLTESLNTYNVTFYMDSLDDNVMSGPHTTKKIYANSEEEAKKKLMDSSTDKYYIPTIVKIEQINEAIEMTADEMKAKHGTDNPDIINAGKPEEERVALKEQMIYTDTNGFLGEPGETYTMSQFRRMWQDKDNDPIMSNYDSFEEWVGETISQMDAHEEDVAPSGRGMASCKIWKDTNGVMGNPGEEYTLNDLADYWTNNNGSDPVLAEYKGDWKAWLDATIPQMEERIDDSLYCEGLESKTFTDKEEAKKFAKDNKGAITSVVDDKLNPTHYVHYKGKKEPVKESLTETVKYPNGMEVRNDSVDMDKALDYMFGTDRDPNNESFTEDEKQRAVDYWIKKTDPMHEDYDEDGEDIDVDYIKQTAKEYDYIGDIDAEIAELGDDPDTLYRMYSDIMDVGMVVNQKQLGKWRFLMLSETDFDEPVIETDNGYYVVCSRGSIALVPIEKEEIFGLDESLQESSEDHRTFADMVNDPEVQRRNAEYAARMKAKYDKENKLAKEAKTWPDDKELTYEEAVALAKAYYNQGGDSFYETIEKYQFDDEVRMFGPMTVGQMKRDFGVFDSVAKDRMAEGLNLNESVEKYELLIEPYERYTQCPLVKKVFNTDSLAKVLEHIANKWMYGFDPIERAADEGWECETREEAIEALQKEYDKAYTQILIDELEGCNGDGCGFIYYLKNLTTGDFIIDSGIEPEGEEEDLFESTSEGASDDFTLSIWNDNELVKDNVWSVSDALEFIHDNGGNTIKVTDHEGERIIWKDGKAVGGGFIGKDIDEYGVTNYFEDGEDVPTHKGPEPFNAWEWMYGEHLSESFSYDKAENLRLQLSKPLQLNDYEAETFEHDINNGRAAEWLEVVKELPENTPGRSEFLAMFNDEEEE